jgi:predicted permease
LHDVLKDASRGSTGGRSHHWIRNGLVVSEIAFACVLLVAAGLLIRSFLRVLDVNMGFRPEHTIAIRVDPDSRYSTRPQQNAYFDEVLRRIRELPRVQSAGLTDSLPLGKNRSWGAGAKGVTYPRGKYPNAFVRVVTDGYVKAMGIPLVNGRDLSELDVPTTDPVIVVNETLARTLWPGQNPLGQIMRACGERRVVGVVGDVRHLALEQAAGLEMYLPIRQCGDFSSVDLVVRSSLPPSELAGAVRAALKPIAPNLPGQDFRTLQQLVDKAVSPRRFVVVLLGGFALFALLLASLGIYAVISYGVNQRTQEIGIRMALGASATRLQAGIILRTLGLAAAGMSIGIIAARGLARAFDDMLFGVTATDPVTLFGIPAVLTVVAVLAGYLPARRAARIDPSIALRAD